MSWVRGRRSPSLLASAILPLITHAVWDGVRGGGGEVDAGLSNNESTKTFVLVIIAVVLDIFVVVQAVLV